MSDLPENDKVNTVSAGRLAEVLGISKRRVEQLAGENKLIRESRGVYLLAESVQSYLNNSQHRDAISESERKGRAKKAEYEGMRAEIKYKAEAGELMDRLDVEQHTIAMVELFINSHGEFIAACTSICRPDADGLKALKATADRYKNAARRQLRKMFPEPKQEIEIDQDNDEI